MGRGGGGRGGGRGPRPARDLLSAFSLSEDLDLAERAARAAGEALVSRFRGPALRVEHKSTLTDPVSEADHEAERLIGEMLRSERPGDGLLAEEGSSALTPEGGRRWIVDPLDGTVNFLYGQAAWCVSVALEDAAGLRVGVVHDPARGETFRASRGGGAELNGARVRASEVAALDRALVATGFGYDSTRRAEQAEVLRHVLPRVRDIRRAGSAALDLAWVAAGRLDGYYERGLQTWDWAAGRLVVEEAGGVALPLEGEPPGLVAAGPAIAEPLRALVREAATRL